MNTAESVSAMPISAGVISAIDLRVASFGDRPSSDMTRSTFSTTTMASSTRRPMASTSANMVSVLMEYPAIDSTPMVPSSTTGTAMAGMSVARRFCRNRNITSTTSKIASPRATTTSLIEARTNGVESELMNDVNPLGKKGWSSASLALTASDTEVALAPSASTMPMPAPGLPFRREVMERLSAPSSTRATSLISTAEPSGATLSKMFLNSSTVLSLVRAVMVALSCWSGAAGRAPSCPAETWAFCAFSAAMMSDGINANFCNRAGFIQMRMA